MERSVQRFPGAFTVAIHNDTVNISYGKYAHSCPSAYISFYAERVMTEMALAVVRTTVVCAWKIFDAVATVAATERKHSRKLIPAAPNE